MTSHRTQRTKVLFYFQFLFIQVIRNCQNCQHTKLFFFSVWHGDSFKEDIDDNFDIVFPERIDKGRMKRDLSTRSKVFNLSV